MKQADALTTIKPPSLKHQIDELIKQLMGEHFGFYSSPDSTDAPYNQHAKDTDGRTTGAEQWRQLRKFAWEVRELEGAREMLKAAKEAAKDEKNKVPMRAVISHFLYTGEVIPGYEDFFRRFEAQP